MRNQWQLFINEWIGTCMSGGELEITGRTKRVALFRCVRFYAVGGLVGSAFLAFLDLMHGGVS